MKYRTMGFNVRNNPKSTYYINWKREIRRCLVCDGKFIPRQKTHYVHNICKSKAYFDIQILRNFRRDYLNPIKTAVELGILQYKMRFTEVSLAGGTHEK